MELASDSVQDRPNRSQLNVKVRCERGSTADLWRTGQRGQKSQGLSRAPVQGLVLN